MTTPKKKQILSEHILIPKYELIKKESEEYKKVVKKYGDPKKFPKILISDPISKNLKAELGDIIKFVREIDDLKYDYYRYVIN